MPRHLVSLVLSVAAVLILACVGWGQEVEEEPISHLVINEIEINPAGLDADREWVELLNPTDEPIDLLGWQISYSYRGDGYLVISESSLIIPPGGRYIYVYPGLRLRNGEPHAIRLLDPEGNLVEETSGFKDEDDSDATWQRFPDGGDPLWPDLWLFQANSRNKSNS